MTSGIVTRARIVEVARQWIGTPYRHQASLKDIGCDCLGLVRGVYRELYGSEPEVPAAYAPDWAEATGRETLIEAATRHLQAVSAGDVGSGDVLLFRWRDGFVAKHAAIAGSATTMIHAHDGAAVCEVALTPWWRRRLAGAFRFPGVTD